MTEALMITLTGIAWPAALAIAWIAGELGYRWFSLPRISSYGIAGFFMAASQGGFLADPSGSAVAQLADFAFALILFELGYRINLRWLQANPWLGVTSLAEAAGTFIAVFLLAQAFSMPMMPALLLAALAMSTSPAALLRVANELKSSGQVTERMLHLSAFNCVLAVIVFRIIIGYWMLADSGSVFLGIWNSVVVLVASAGLGALFGIATPGFLRSIGNVDKNATVTFALAALLLTAVSHAFKFSPILAALAFGLVSRHRRVVLSQAHRNFGALGDLLTVLLFVFVTASLEWKQVILGIELALPVVLVRLAVKTIATTAFARLGGITWRKGALTGLAMMPMSVFVILLLEQARHLEIGALEQVSGVAAIALLLEVLGPILTQRALIWAKETHHTEEH
ncbi:Kef-type K+ transport system, membrane component KefB [Formivibrio citricus]|uniref:Kef-type K+ transport system, membrane component KefB n=1 Tax=Formivibrio citricus TaxID=83765 RepID=A0A1I4YY21_9NEIS|nr:cation:proton antiporter [Formivibrio citricus]SFN42901.1 Kef-type K+ transport system, membrane component KefB [Formivibrio citricus]